jgi:hypothetical protein
MISGEPHLMFCLGVKHLARYVSVHSGGLILMVIMKTLQTKYTLETLNPKDDYSTEIVRSKFTRDVASTFKEVHEELIMAIDDLIPETEHSA